MSLKLVLRTLLGTQLNCLYLFILELIHILHEFLAEKVGGIIPIWLEFCWGKIWL